MDTAKAVRPRAESPRRRRVHLGLQLSRGRIAIRDEREPQPEATQGERHNARGDATTRQACSLGLARQPNGGGLKGSAQYVLVSGDLAK
jgi:hypothetical protein